MKLSLKNLIISILIVNLLIVGFQDVKPSQAIGSILTDTFSGTLEDADWYISPVYSLTYGDQIGINITVTNADSTTSDLTVYLETPDYTGGIQSYLLWGYVNQDDVSFEAIRTIKAYYGDTEGDHQIRVTNDGFAGGDSITVDIKVWSFTNTFASGNFITPSESERVEGNTSISWSFTDPDSDVLSYSIYYHAGNTTDMAEIVLNGEYLGYTYDSIFYWDSTQHADGICTIMIVVWEDNDPYSVSNYHFVHPKTDNTNDPPSVSINSPVQSQEYSSNITISSTGADPNNDQLTYTFAYSTDGNTFDNEIVNNIVESNYDWNISSLTDGINYRIMVTVQDEHGLSISAVTGKFTIDNPEYVSWGNISDTVYEPILIVKIETNGISADLFLDGLSKGKQTSGFEWTVLLSLGIHDLSVTIEDNLGTKTVFTKFVTYSNQTTTEPSSTEPSSTEPSSTNPNINATTTDFFPISVVVLLLAYFHTKRRK